MKTPYQSLLLALGALALAGTSFAQVPSTNDTSDPPGNTGMGTGALATLDTGPAARNANTAAGYNALNSTYDGGDNTALGSQAGANYHDGDFNTAVGSSALNGSVGSGGSYNTALGASTLRANTSGNYNTGTGYFALTSNGEGDFNTGNGVEALANTQGNNNTALGYQAGYNLQYGNNNIDIGNVGVDGDSDFIRIGTRGTHKGAFIAGISTFKATGSAVYVTPTGRLGVLASSERFKTAIAPIGDSTEKLQQLRPVSFHLKAEPKGAVQYGLVAEEVAKVYPELVIRDEKGRIDGVRYEELTPMLLNEVQKQQSKNAAQDSRIRDLEQQVAEMHAAFLKLQAKDERVAQR